jgi:hypothetical protein
MLVCSNCGFDNQSNSRFCGGCGKLIEEKYQVRKECPLCHAESPELGTPLIEAYIAMHCEMKGRDFVYYGNSFYFASQDKLEYERIAEYVYSDDASSSFREDDSDQLEVMNMLGVKNIYVVIQECETSFGEYNRMYFKKGISLDVIQVVQSAGEPRYIRKGVAALPVNATEVNIDFKTAYNMMSSAEYLANYRIDNKEYSEFVTDLDADVCAIPNALRVLFFSALFVG